MRRWEKIDRSATQQSGRGTLMQSDRSRAGSRTSLTRFSSRIERCAGLFPYEGEALDFVEVAAIESAKSESCRRSGFSSGLRAVSRAKKSSCFSGLDWIP